MAELTRCPRCGARFDHEAHRLPVPEPGVDEMVDTSTTVMAICPQCGERVPLEGSSPG